MKTTQTDQEAVVQSALALGEDAAAAVAASILGRLEDWTLPEFVWSLDAVTAQHLGRALGTPDRKRRRGGR